MMVWVFLAQFAAIFFLLGYLIATKRMTQHLREANDRNSVLTGMLAEAVEEKDEADWWKESGQKDPPVDHH